MYKLSDKHINYINSEHSNHYEDRRWDFECAKGNFAKHFEACDQKATF